jgi:hypothetical protein
MRGESTPTQPQMKDVDFAYPPMMEALTVSCCNEG